MVQDVLFELQDNIEQKELIIGIRPEKMLEGDASIMANVDIVEMSGADKTVYFELNGSKCSAKVPLNYPINKNITLNLDVKNFYLFDKITGKNINYKENV